MIIFLIVSCSSFSQADTEKESVAVNTAVITVIEGNSVEFRITDSSEWQPAEEEIELSPGSSVKTGPESRVELQLSDNSIIRVNDLSLFKFKKPEETLTVLDVERGKTWIHLKKLESGQRFEVRTPNAYAGVRGTTFWVESDPETEDVIGVEEGEVEVVRGQQRQRLKKMMQINARAGRLGDAKRFDPDKRKRWEKFTDGIVKKRMEILRDTIKKQRDDARKLIENGKELFQDAIKLGIEAKKTIGELEKTAKQIEQLAKQVDGLEKNKKQSPGGKKKNKKDTNQTARQVDKLLENALEIESRFQKGQQNINTIFDSARDYFDRAKTLEAGISRFKELKEQFAERSELSRKRREFDPNWQEFKGIHSTAEQHIKDFREKLTAGDKLLEGMEDKTDKTRQKMVDKIENLKKYIEENRTRFENSHKSLQSSIAKLRRMEQKSSK